jgi:small subunit ribosomal protein S6
MNIECDKEALGELEHAFRFNDAVLRHLVIVRDEAIVEPSPMMRSEKSRAIPTGEEKPAAQPSAAA